MKRPQGTVAAGVLLGILVVMAALAPLVTWHAPDAVDLAERRQAPTLTHPFGTDDLGRDVFARVIYGARVSLAIGLLSAAITGIMGITAGAGAGFAGGWIDALLMRVTDAMLAIPRLPLLMVAAAIFEPTIPVLIVLVGVVGWMETARVVRAEFLSLRERPFVDAARAAGLRPLRVVFHHILPNAAPAAVVAVTLAVGRGILLESTMSFFGVGVQPPQSSWGNMLYQAQSTMTTEPWVAVFPGLFIFGTVFSVFTIGDRVGADKAPA